MLVEVDIKDLEKITFATAIIKTIENAFTARSNDPFVKPHLEFADAHNNLVTAITHARRADSDTTTPWDGELTEKEIRVLEQLEAISVREVLGDQRMKTKEIDSLAAKGCLRIGQLVRGCVWPGEQKPDIRPEHGYAISITDRGRKKYAQATQKSNQESNAGKP